VGYTKVTGIQLSSLDVSSIRAWRDEIELKMGFDGKEASMVETYRFVLEDFAQQYREQKQLDIQEMK